jgi:hypothetical protein
MLRLNREVVVRNENSGRYPRLTAEERKRESPRSV